MTYCKLLLCFALLLNFYFFAFSLNVFLSFNWLMMFHKWAILSAWVCYLTQLRVFSDALWIRCTVCIEYSPIYLNYLKPWTCVYLRYTSGTALGDTRTVGRYILKDFVLHIIYVIYSTTHIYDIYSVTCICVIYDTTWWTYTYSTNCWTELDDGNIPACYVDDGCDDFLVDWYAHVIFAAVFAPNLDLTYLCRDCVFIYECPSWGWTMIFWMHIWSMTWFVFILCVIYLSRHLLTCCHDFQCCHPFIMVCYFTYNLNFILN